MSQHKKTSFEQDEECNEAFFHQAEQGIPTQMTKAQLDAIRQKKKIQVHVDMPLELLNALDEASQRVGKTREAMINQAIQEYLRHQASQPSA